MNPFQLGLRPLFFFFCLFTVLLSVDFVSAQGLLITEFQAFNESTIQDEDNEYTDWIEIFNSGEAAVNLNGYYLTDSVAELTKWQFPAVTLQSGRFLVVFASGKDRRNPASELHTNFSIERNGGEKDGWLYLTGAYDDIDRVRRSLGVYDLDPVIDADKSEHSGLITFGNDRTDRWAALPALMNSHEIVETVLRITRDVRSRPVQSES